MRSSDTEFGRISNENSNSVSVSLSAHKHEYRAEFSDGQIGIRRTQKGSNSHARIPSGIGQEIIISEVIQVQKSACVATTRVNGREYTISQLVTSSRLYKGFTHS